jgi:hypothetical protein
MLPTVAVSLLLAPAVEADEVPLAPLLDPRVRRRVADRARELAAAGVPSHWREVERARRHRRPRAVARLRPPERGALRLPDPLPPGAAAAGARRAARRPRARIAPAIPGRGMVGSALLILPPETPMEMPMKTAEDIESYLIQMEAQYEAVGDGVWVVKDMGPELVLSIADSVLVFRMKVLDTGVVLAPKLEQLFRKLLELNAEEMLHGAYGLEPRGAVVVTDALQLENLDFNEFQATLEDIGMAVSNHYPTLSKYTA